MDKIVPINRIDTTEQYIVVPRLIRGKIRKRLKRLLKVKGNCWFTQGVALDMVDFIYRAVVRLGLRERKLIFSRGTVRIGDRISGTAVEILELDWDLGTSIIIPQKTGRRSACAITIDGNEHSVKIMEIILLSALLKLKYPRRGERWRNDMAAAVICLGWKVLDREIPPVVLRRD